MLCLVETGIDDLQRVLEVHDITNNTQLGLNLGLHMPAIEKIQAQYTQSLNDQKTQILYAWMKRDDIILSKQSCLPTWSELADAVAKESSPLSRSIRLKYCPTSS